MAAVAACGSKSEGAASGANSGIVSDTNVLGQDGNEQVAGSIVDGKLVLTPAGEVGPFWVDEKLQRVDITAEADSTQPQAGTPLSLSLRVLNVVGSQATPIVGALVDIWQANALGVYSDEASENTTGQKWLRGYQVTDAQGAVRFKTIVPGWYAGRTTHIHARVRVFGNGQATDPTYNWTTHLFLDDALTDIIYAKAPYASHPGRDTHNTNDHVYQASCNLGAQAVACGELMMLSVQADGEGFAGAAEIYLDTSVAPNIPASQGGGGAPPP